MVGFVIVSHSENLAKSVVELTSIMAPNARIAPAGGMDDGGFGTSFEKIQAAIESVYSDDGVLVLVDLGSAVMTTEMVIGPARRKALMRHYLSLDAIKAASIEELAKLPSMNEKAAQAVYNFFHT